MAGLIAAQNGSAHNGLFFEHSPGLRVSARVKNMNDFSFKESRSTSSAGVPASLEEGRG
jgi:hypothetical protein